MTAERQTGLSGSLEPGMRLGDLLLVRRAGAGAQGEVWEARQTGVDRRVAVKVQRAPPGGAGAERFRREAAAAARLSHAGIVALHDLREHDGLRLIVQEFVDGQSLAALIARRREQGPAPDPAWCRRAAETCARLAEALQHAHERGVVHRDVKPGNVLLANDGSPKLTDFGLARVQGSPALSITGEILGTPWFMSPEQVLGHVADARSDVYSLGAVLYELLTLHVPHPGNDQHAVFAHILGRAPQRPRSLAPAVAPDLQAVCLKALERWPQDRYATAGEMAADLDRFLRGQPTRARPVGLLGRAWRGVTRASTPALGAAACLIAAGWLALERWVMAPAILEGGVSGALRLGTLVVAASAVMVLVALLAIRQGRTWMRGVAIAVLAIELACVVAAGWALIRRLDHRLDHAVIVATLRESKQRALALATVFQQRWGDAFDASDQVLMAIVLLGNDRVDAADAHILELTREDVVSAVGWALEVAVASALAQDERAFRAREHLLLAEAAGLGADEWTTVGDVFVTAGSLDEAREAYLHASGLRPSRDLERRLMRLDADQCRWEDAATGAQLYLQKSPSDVGVQLIALGAALHANKPDDDVVDQRLDVIKRNAPRPYDALKAEYDVLQARKQPEQSNELLRRAERDHGGDAEVIDWLAKTAYADARFEDARRLYVQLLSLSAAPAVRIYEVWARVGLSASAQKLGDLSTAKEQAEAAIQADDSLGESFINYFSVRLRSAGGQPFDPNAVSPEEWQACAGILEQALSRNGFVPKVLNNLAYVLQRTAEATGDRALGERAMSYADRAVTVASTGGDCRADDAGWREVLSNAFDTRSRLHESQGDSAAAIADEESAVHTLLESDPQYPVRKARLEKLRSGS